MQIVDLFTTTLNTTGIRKAVSFVVQFIVRVSCCRLRLLLPPSPPLIDLCERTRSPTTDANIADQLAPVVDADDDTHSTLAPSPAVVQPTILAMYLSSLCEQSRSAQRRQCAAIDVFTRCHGHRRPTFANREHDAYLIIININLKISTHTQNVCDTLHMSYILCNSLNCRIVLQRLKHARCTQHLQTTKVFLKFYS
jgi:hypothetical protein